MSMRTANPVFNSRAFGTYAGGQAYGYRPRMGDRMTLSGTVNATLVLFGVLLIGALVAWYSFFVLKSVFLVFAFLIGGLIGSLVAFVVIMLKPTWAQYAAPVYAGFEGLMLGALSAIFELYYPGIVVEAFGLTFGVFLLMLLIYKSGLIKVNSKFIMAVMAATGAIMIVYLITFMLGFFGMTIPYIHQSGPVGIAFSLIVIGVACLNLVLDFFFIEQGVDNGAPKYMEWYAAFGLMVTLIWLYIEILRLLAKMRNN